MPLPNGPRIRARREELDLRPAELAARLGISTGYLRNVEGGRDPIRNAVGHRIARALAISFEDVMGTNDGVPDTPPKQPPNAPKGPTRRQDSEQDRKGPRRADGAAA